MYQWISRLLLVSYLVISLPWLSKALDAANIFYFDQDGLHLTAFELGKVSPETYTQAIQAALEQADVELANSLFELSQQQVIRLTNQTQLERELAQANSWWAVTQRTSSELWRGFWLGEVHSANSLAASTLSDFLLVGDVRDLGRELANWPDADQLVLGLSAVGVGLSVGTVVSGGSSALAAAGASSIKAAKKAGKLNKQLLQQLTDISKNSINPVAVQAVKQQWQHLKLSQLNRASFKQLKAPLAQLIQPQAVRHFKAVSSNMGAISTHSGLRGTLETLSRAESVAQIGRLAKVSQKFKQGYVGALKLLPRLGKKLVWLSGVMLELVASLLNALLWSMLLLWNVFKVGRRIFS